MCNIFSGHIIAEKGKEWGKVIFISGVHHEKDRESLGDKRMLAWQSTPAYSLDSFEFTHDCGQNIPENEKKELMNLLILWGKNQNKESLLRKMITVIKYNKPTEEYQIQDNMIKIGDNMSCVCDFGVVIQAGDSSTQTAGDSSTQTAWESSTQTAGDSSTQTAKYRSTQTAGYSSTQTAGHSSTQTAGDSSTQTAGDSSTQTAGDSSTQTAGHSSTQTAGDSSTQTAGDSSTQTAGDSSTQTAGERSTQTAGDSSTQTAGDSSTQTAGHSSTCIIWGDTSYVILDGVDILLIQKYYLNNKFIQKIVDVNNLFKKHKKGDKIKIVKGKEVEN